MDSLEAWPEPVVAVQSLAEADIETIPKNYIKPESERPSLTDVSSPNTLQIPVIDLGGLAEGVVECRATMKAISDACRDWGFFQVVNHGVSVELMSKMKEIWRAFFHLPMDQKQSYANSPTTYEGYGSRLGVDKDSILDWGDYFYLHLLPFAIKNPNKWPSLPSSIRETIEEYGSEVVKLCELLMKVMSLSLGLDVGDFQEAFGGEEVGACMRVNYYPKCPQPELTLGLSPHSDPGGLTVLLPDHHVQGLQVRKAGSWVTVQPLPNSFIVNIGDQIQVLSNAVYKSVEHRVIVNAEVERISIAFFYNPKSDLPVGPARQLITPDRPPLYRSMTFNEYRLYIRKKGPRGKTQVESLKAA